MSRIGNKPVDIPENVTVAVDNGLLTVKGSKGELTQLLPQGVSIDVTDGQVIVKRESEMYKPVHGLVRSLLSNMVVGVSQGYVKKLELVGTGYRARKQGQGLVISAGYSQPVEYTSPKEVELVTEGDTVIAVSGIDKQLVGQVAAEIRKIRPPEPYKGKGIRYQGEVIRRKAGKATKTGA